MTTKKIYKFIIHDMDKNIFRALKYAAKKRGSMKMQLWVLEAIIEKLERENIQIQESEGDNDVHQ